jgi:ATP-dependent HslUV protease ATP-binding subunit HslU
MVIYLPTQSIEDVPALDELTPREIVRELDRYVVGQADAKRAVAVALRNRVRRQKLDPEMAEDVMPKNILMIGPTGVGKTEIARRLAKLANAPFVKVEATKFTEVGYVGRDVDSMVRDLVQISVRLIEGERMEEVKDQAQSLAEERVLDLLQPLPQNERGGQGGMGPFGFMMPGQTPPSPEMEENYRKRHEQAERVRARLREQLAMGALDDRRVEIEVEESAVAHMPAFSEAGMEEITFNLGDMLGGMFPKKKRKRNVTVREAREVLAQEEARKLIDPDQVKREAVERAEQHGIIFIDEMDKIAGREGGTGPDVSRGGVQRDILPIIEGSTVMTKFGPVRTDHVLFVAAGAFHMSKPSDLIPELQGRLPIRVELENLGEGDFRRILTEPRNALIRQYEELLATEGVRLEFTEDGIAEIARTAATVNTRTENIGARRLHTVLEKLLEEVSFQAPHIDNPHIVIDAAYVRDRLAAIVADQDLARYIL